MAQTSIDNIEKQAFYGVYDGHGGSRASEFVAQNLHQMVLASSYRTDPEAALAAAYKRCDDEWLKKANRHGWDDGTTAVSVLIKDYSFWVANTGDSRCVLSCKGKAVDMSHDHKPARKDEKQRVEALGGRIIHYGTWRVEGVLAVTRAIGDRRLKKYVCPDPEIKERALKAGDEFLVLATDGVWDVLSSQECIDVVRSVCGDNTRVDTATLEAAAQRVVDTCYKRGSQDNITCIVVDLKAYQA